MHIGPVEGGGELRVLIEQALPHAPVVVLAPVGNQALHESVGDAVALVTALGFWRPPGSVKAVPEVSQCVLGDLNTERHQIFARHTHHCLLSRCHSREYITGLQEAGLSPVPAWERRTV